MVPRTFRGVRAWLRTVWMRRPKAIYEEIGRATRRRRRALKDAIHQAMEPLESRIFPSTAPAISPIPQIANGTQATFVAIQSYEPAIGARFYNKSGASLQINNVAVGDFTGNGTEDYQGGR